jgi:hypothetical protein
MKEGTNEETNVESNEGRTGGKERGKERKITQTRRRTHSTLTVVTLTLFNIKNQVIFNMCLTMDLVVILTLAFGIQIKKQNVVFGILKASYFSI